MSLLPFSVRDNALTRALYRFGNFIGEEAESEEASEAGAEAGDYIYDDEPEEATGVTGQELMEIDGTCCAMPGQSGS